MSKVIVRDLAACAGCKICMNACSLVHEGECRPSHARLNVHREPLSGATTIVISERCDHCEGKFSCVKWCPAHVFKVEREG